MAKNLKLDGYDTYRLGRLLKDYSDNLDVDANLFFHKISENEADREILHNRIDTLSSKAHESQSRLSKLEESVDKLIVLAADGILKESRVDTTIEEKQKELWAERMEKLGKEKKAYWEGCPITNISHLTGRGKMHEAVNELSEEFKAKQISLELLVNKIFKIGFKEGVKDSDRQYY